MKLLYRLLILSTLLTACTAHANDPIPPREIAGIKLPQQVELGITKLELNGAGIRYFAVFKTYVAALYLPSRTSSAQEAISAAGAHRIQITFLVSRDARDTARSFAKAIEAAAPRDQMSKLIPGLIALGNGFHGFTRSQVGDNLSIDWVPGTGTTISLNGRPVFDVIREPEFNEALMRIYLGEKPLDSDLRDRLLGKK